MEEDADKITELKKEINNFIWMRGAPDMTLMQAEFAATELLNALMYPTHFVSQKADSRIERLEQEVNKQKIINQQLQDDYNNLQRRFDCATETIAKNADLVRTAELVPDLIDVAFSELSVEERKAKVGKLFLERRTA